MNGEGRTGLNLSVTHKQIGFALACLGIVVLTGCVTATEAPGLPNGSPKELYAAFTAYFDAGVWDRATLCLSPRLRRAALAAFREKEEYDALARRLTAEFLARGMAESGESVRVMSSETNRVFRRAFFFRDEFLAKQLVEPVLQEGQCNYSAGGAPIGYTASHADGAWQLGVKDPPGFVADMGMLVALLRGEKRRLRAVLASIEKGSGGTELGLRSIRLGE